MLIDSLGAKIPDDRFRELKNPIICLDTDKTGLTNSLKYAKKGHTIFIKPNHIKGKDLNEIKINHPDIDILALIQENSFKGIAASVRIKPLL